MPMSKAHSQTAWEVLLSLFSAPAAMKAMAALDFTWLSAYLTRNWQAI
jgi:hypothetical protein